MPFWEQNKGGCRVHNGRYSIYNSTPPATTMTLATIVSTHYHTTNQHYQHLLPLPTLSTFTATTNTIIIYCHHTNTINIYFHYHSTTIYHSLPLPEHHPPPITQITTTSKTSCTTSTDTTTTTHTTTTSTTSKQNIH